MFTLKKVQLTKYDGLEISYSNAEETLSREEQNDPVDYKVKSLATPHPDLVNLFGMLNVVVADIFGMADFDELKLAIHVDEIAYKAGNAELMLKLHSDIYDRIKVKGIEYAAGQSVILYWEWIAKNETITKLATPRIKLDSEVFGFEDYLSEIAQRIHEETYAYIKGKRAQLSLFGEDVEQVEQSGDE